MSIPVNNRSNETTAPPDRLWTILGIMIVSGFALIFFLGVNHLYIRFDPKDPNPFWSNLRLYLVSVGVGMLIAGAFFSAGGFIGFLFGIPRILQNAALNEQTAKNRPLLVQNDNLVEVSDWLTKIIVGVGLTQISKIPGKIYDLGGILGTSFSGNGLSNLDENGRNSAIAIILYFTIVGFFTAYLWTRLFFSRRLLQTEEELRGKLEETEQKLESTQIEKQETEKQLKTAEEEGKIKTEDMKAVLKTFSSEADLTKSKKEIIRQSEEFDDDPQKGKWGGKPEVNGRKISANVRPTSFNEEWFNVYLEVISTDANKPLIGEVVFHLHPSFPNDVEKVNAENNIAALNLVAWGAFTVGVECDGGQTKLELDLAELPDAPHVFKSR
jgi:hypothetical protein